MLIVGAGPVGLSLAIELGSRGIACLVIEQSTEDAANFPTANNISIRTMEQLRRWGIAAQARELARDLPYGRLWMTSLDGCELARFSYPPNGNPIPQPFSPETFLWCPKPLFDPFLARHARSLGSVELRYRCRSAPLEEAAAVRGLPLRVADIHLPEALHLYQRRLTLVRPDGFVAWRGDELPAEPMALVDAVRGV